ncbi:hypothetical protein K6L44_15205 [Gluconacetobacter entanii]|nr:hypothetical protein [Gluconacetobacter entanii]MCE2576979.1 hypothetical protein [Komagataeibacter sp. FNDCR1]MBY4641308.1 hypothetical protein [Gluconacetobacter entanii]MCW4579033.1 hypothetical protein [Gluconacetobacter entanii]MCW4582433.1 hypothetical protein [Gluconacetobacter entanii]MCW4585817.1 hypothetical protein [Gluconacetobacter entanii]
MEFSPHDSMASPPSPTGSSGNSMVNIIYILYLIGFFIPGTSAMGIILAYINRDSSTQPYTSHFQFQITLFLKGLLYAIAGLVLYLCSIAIAALTGGAGIILLAFPALLMLWWAAWTIYSIIRGMSALNRNLPIS